MNDQSADGAAMEPDLENPSQVEQVRFVESLLNVTPGILYIYDLTEKRNVFTNVGIQRILGYSIREIQAMGDAVIASLMHPEDLASYADRILPKYAKAVDAERIVHQYRMKHRNGQWRWIESTEVIYQRHPGGAPAQILGLGLDITDRKNAEIELEETKAILSEFVLHSPIYAFIKDVTPTESRVLMASDNFRDMIGIPGSEMVGKTMPELFPQDLAAKITADDWEVASQRSILRVDEDLNGRNYTSFKFAIQRGERTLLAGYTIDISEMKKGERELAETRAILQAALDQSPAGIAIADAPSGALRYVNDAGLMVRGEGREKISAGVGIQEYVASWQLFDLSGRPLEPTEVPLARAILYGETNSREFIVRRGDNEDRIVMANAAPILDADGKTQSAIVVFMDVTENKRAEVALRESEYFFKESQRASHTGSYRLDVKTGQWECSEVLDQIFGIDDAFQHDVGGWVHLVHPDDRSSMMGHYADEVVGQRKKFDKEYRIIRHGDGEVRWVHGMGELILDDQGAPTHMIGTIRDITEHHAAELALQHSEERLKLATQAAQIGVWDWNIAENSLLWDDSMFALYGVERNHFGGVYDAWARGLHREDSARIDAAIQAAIEGKGEFSEEFRIVRPDGVVRILKAQSQAHRDAQGKALRMIGVNIDITERQEAAQELERHRSHLEDLVQERTAQLEAANRELESFCHSVSHDLRAPLRHLDGFTRLLVSDCRESLGGDGQRYVDTIASAARKMGVLIDDLLEFSRTSRQEMGAVRVDMNAVLREALLPLQEESAGRAVEWVIGDLPSVQGDHNLLRQVWANLLQNAVKYSHPREKARIEIKGWTEGEELRYSVSDNGVGFDMRFAGKLFGVFQRLHRQDEFEGTGIGLAIVHRIVSRHGGCIWAQSALDQGATFTIALPKPKEAANV
ncbi:MAG: PAS domain-containing protein [Fibrobacterota bacterium]|nr:MAG: PAS domain-containing protein [Fibrobacterota bacterium]